MKFIYIKNRNKYIKKIAREAFILFFKSLSKNNFYQLKNVDLDLKDNEKRKIWHNISKICHDLILGYEKQKIELILSAIKKINLLNKSDKNLIVKSEE